VARKDKEATVHLFVPYDGSVLARTALRAAYRMAGPLDEVSAMASVIVPLHLPLDVESVMIWKLRFRAEWKLTEAQEYAQTIAQSGDTLRCVRVRARDHAAAIVAGAVHFQADLLVLAQYTSRWRYLTGYFGTCSRVLRAAPCDVHTVYVVPEGHSSRYADDPHDTRAVIGMSTPFQQPFLAAVCEDTGTPDSRIDAVIRSVRGYRVPT